MCGIAGYITQKDIKLLPEKQDKRGKIFTGLLVAMEDRGGQSAGVLGIDNKNCQIVKAPIAATKFIQLRKFRELLLSGYPLMIGHTRFATTGDVSKRNAHPFRRGLVAGVHNGIVTNYEEISPKAQVDSEAIFDLLSRHNNDYEKAFKKLSGSFAIAWATLLKDDYALYLVSAGQPLHLAYVAELKTWFYCSTPEALRIVLSSHYVKNTIYELAEEEVLMLNSNLEITKKKVKFKSIGIEYSWEKYNDYYDNYPRGQEFCLTCHQPPEFCACDKEEIINQKREKDYLACDNCGITLTHYGVSCEESGSFLCKSCARYFGIQGIKIPIEEIYPKENYENY